MADYSPDALEARNDIAEDGGPIEFMVYPAHDNPDDPTKPWLGSGTERTPFPWHALFVPVSPNAPDAADNFTELAYIAGFELPFDIVQGTQFRTATTQYQVEQVKVLRPDGVTPILYTCEVTSWART